MPHGPQVALPIYIAKMLKSLKAKFMEESGGRCLTGDHGSARVTQTFSSRYPKGQHPIGQLCRVCIYQLCGTRLHTEVANMFGKQQCVN